MIRQAGSSTSPASDAVIGYSGPTNVLVAFDTGDRILGIDVLDTGDTYEAAITHLQDFQPREIRTAVLLHKTTAKYQPDFIARKIVKWRWMIYPCAVIEDLGGFVTRMSPKPRDAGEIGQRLEAEYGLKLQAARLDLLARLLRQRGIID